MNINWELCDIIEFKQLRERIRSILKDSPIVVKYNLVKAAPPRSRTDCNGIKPREVLAEPDKMADRGNRSGLHDGPTLSHAMGWNSIRESEFHACVTWCRKCHKLVHIDAVFDWQDKRSKR